MVQKEIFVLLADGVSLRNFAYTQFKTAAEAKGMKLTYWNLSAFDLETHGFCEKKIAGAKLHPLTEVYKNAKTRIELALNKARERDAVYDDYLFPIPKGTFIKRVKGAMVRCVEHIYGSPAGITSVKKTLNKLERSTPYYQKCRATLEKHRPHFVFCTSQRNSLAIAPMNAARDLGIPTATFIFSWDNLPKATLLIDTDFYFVWSEHMKSELLRYYESILPGQVIVTGTPQFEPHSESDLITAREAFFERHGLKLTKKYIVYSGDDVTTSPDDPDYLRDTAEAVRGLNARGYDLGLIFRRCPTDLSNRYEAVVGEYSDVISELRPYWSDNGSRMWNAVFPEKEDIALLMNTIFHSEMVINIGSSMVFDYVAFNKPCAYIRYDQPNKRIASWSVAKIYNYVHFRSMPSNAAVLWITAKTDISRVICEGLGPEKVNIVNEACVWFRKINEHPISEASARIVAAIENVLTRDWNGK